MMLKRHGESPHSWEIYRGDSFQAEVAAEHGLSEAILLKAAIRHVGLDVRMALGVGTVDFRADRLTESNGTAFVRSGDAFEKLEKNTLSVYTGDSDFDKTMEVMLKLALLTMDRWTSNSAEMVMLTLLNPDATQNQLAEMLHIGQGRISERQQRAGMDALRQFTDWFSREINQRSTH